VSAPAHATRRGRAVRTGTGPGAHTARNDPRPSAPTGGPAHAVRPESGAAAGAGTRAGENANPGVVVLAAGMAALAGAAFASAFDAGDLVVPVAAGAVGAAAVSAVLTGVGRRRLAVASLGAVALLVPLAMVAIGGGPSDVLTGVQDGARSILTSAVPTPAGPPVLVVPFALTAVAAFLGAEIGQRTRSAAAPVVPSLVVLIGGLAFGLAGSRPDGWVIVAWMVAAGLMIGVRRLGESTGAAGGPAPAGSPGAESTPVLATAAVRRALAVVPVVLLAAAVGHAAGPRLPGAGDRDRFELRDLVDQPAPPRQMANPLDVMTGLLEGPDDTVFVAETSERVDRWRLAVLDTYDGQTWFSDVSYVPAGHRLPEPADGLVEGGRTVTQTIEPAGLEGHWLPVVDRPVSISVDDVLFDSESGVLLTSAGRLPDAYEATSVVPEANAAELAAASVATDDEAERALDLPSWVPEDLTAAADEITAGSTSAYMRATAIERFLAQSTAEVPFRLAVERPPTGHSFGHLRCFLFNVERCGRQGSTEQFVAAYALLARSAGLPTRIAVGFTSSGNAGRDDVTAHEATAWTEVKFDGLGWVPFNPVPNPDVTTTPPPADVAGGGASPDGQTSTTVARPDETTEDEEPADEEETSAGDGGVLPWVVAAAVVLVAVLVTPTVVRSRRRSRRRRAADAGERIAGAWAEAVDQLARSGVHTPASAAVKDVALAGRVELDGVAEPLGPLADLVNRSRFARDRSVEADAAEAWRLSDSFAEARRRSRTAPQRTRELFSVRSPAARLSRRF
jgi:TgpA N-terminal domain/Transglutaminase-like superfamily